MIIEDVSTSDNIYVVSWDCAMKSIACVIMRINPCYMSDVYYALQPRSDDLNMKFRQKRHNEVLESAVVIEKIICGDIFAGKNLADIPWNEKVVTIKRFIEDAATTIAQIVKAHRASPRVYVIIEKQPNQIIGKYGAKINLNNIAVEHFLYYHFCNIYPTSVISPKKKLEVAFAGNHYVGGTGNGAYGARKSHCVRNFHAAGRIFPQVRTAAALMPKELVCYIDDIADAFCSGYIFAAEMSNSFTKKI